MNRRHVLLSTVLLLFVVNPARADLIVDTVITPSNCIISSPVCTTLTIQSGSLRGGLIDDFAGGFDLQAPEVDFAIFGAGMGSGPSYHFRQFGLAQKSVPSDLGGTVNFNNGNVSAIQSGVSFGDFPTHLSGFLDFSVVIPDPQAGLAVVPFSLTGEVRGSSATGEEAFQKPVDPVMGQVNRGFGRFCFLSSPCRSLPPATVGPVYHDGVFSLAISFYSALPHLSQHESGIDA